MRKLLLFFLLSVPAYCAPAVVQGCQNYGGPSSITSLACTFASPITAGNALYLCTNLGASGVVTLSGDSDTFVADPGSGSAITNKLWFNGSVTCAYVSHATGGGTTITMTFSANTYAGISAIEISGSTGVIDKSDSGNNFSTATTTPASNSITTTQNGDLLIGVVLAANNATISAGTNVGWALISSTHSSLSEEMESYIQTTSGAVSSTFTIGSNTAWAHIVSFVASLNPGGHPFIF